MLLASRQTAEEVQAETGRQRTTSLPIPPFLALEDLDPTMPLDWPDQGIGYAGRMHEFKS